MISVNTWRECTVEFEEVSFKLFIKCHPFDIVKEVSKYWGHEHKYIYIRFRTVTEHGVGGSVKGLYKNLILVWPCFKGAGNSNSI